MHVAGSVLCAFLLACTHALLLAATANDTTPRAASPRNLTGNPSIDRLWPRLAPDPHASHASVIAILSSRQLIQSRFQHVCGARTSAPPNVPELPEACWSLQRACHRVFRSSLTGIAGHFTRPQLAALQHCAGTEGITYLTRDGQVRSGWPHCSAAASAAHRQRCLCCVQVQKAEGQAHKDWWTYRAPANMTLEQLQQLAASKLGAATAAGVGSASAAAGNATDSGSSSSNTSPLQVQASGGPTQRDSSSSSATSATMALIQRWIIAEVGLAAQQELSQPNMQSLPQQVRAANQPSAAVQVSADGASTVSVTLQGLQSVQLGPQLLVTAQVAADGAAGGEGGQVAVSNQQPAGSKNQDPGIPVDPQAVAQPGEDS